MKLEQDIGSSRSQSEQMATTPLPIPTLTHDLQWLRHHLYLLAAVGVFVVGGIYGIETLIQNHDQKNDEKWKSIVVSIQQQNKQLADKLSTDEANWAAQQQQLLAMNSKLETGIEKRDAQLQTQRQKDASLSAAEVAVKLTQQTSAKPDEINAQGDTVILDLPVSRRIAQDLDTLPVVQADLTDTKNQLKNETQVATNLQADVTGQKTLIVGLNTQLVDQDKSCKASIAVEKSKARKGKFKAFFYGVAVTVGGFLLHLVGV